MWALHLALYVTRSLPLASIFYKLLPSTFQQFFPLFQLKHKFIVSITNRFSSSREFLFHFVHLKSLGSSSFHCRSQKRFVPFPCFSPSPMRGRFFWAENRLALNTHTRVEVLVSTYRKVKSFVSL